MPRQPNQGPVQRASNKPIRNNLRKAIASGPEVVLLAVTGMSPAILTETVWALAQENPPSLPHRIIVLTTAIGKEQIVEELFTPQPYFNGQCGWDCLRQKLEDQGHHLQGKLRFDPTSDDLHVLTRWEERVRRKRPLSDIRTASENDAVADQILETVRGLVATPDIHLIVSIAGGRKTMGTLLYACMTLIGREGDRVTHVLVDEPFADPRLKPKFYFPEQSVAELEVTPEKKSVHAKNARIVLADLPFVPLHNLLAKELGRMPGGFLTLVAQCSKEVRQRAAADVKLVVHRSRSQIEVNGKLVELSAREQLLVLFLADRVHQGQPPFGRYEDATDSLNAYQRELKASAPADDFSDWRWRPGTAFDERDIVKVLSDLRKKLKQVSSDALVLIDRLPKHGRLSLDLQRAQIGIVE
jgi:CRISPR-associated protein (TIGR02584 family)